MFKPSKYQEKIFEFIKNDTKNAVISAVAGSGKTTTLLKALEIIPENKKVLFLAFNKSIANELKLRVGNKNNVKIVTVHALGYNSIMRTGNSPVIESNKYEKVYNEIFLSKVRKKGSNLIIENNFKKDIIKLIENFFNPIKTPDDVNWGDIKQSVVKLCDLGRMYNINVTDKKKGLNELKNIANHYGVSIENNEHELALSLIKIGGEVNNTIDFTDMIYLPLKNNYQLEKYDIVFIDECQDLNTCQLEIMLRSIKENTGRFIAVGDKKQCQPKDSKILMYDGTYKNIQDIIVGDYVVTYDNKNKGSFIGFYKNHRWGADSIKKYGRKVLKTSKRLVNEKIITLKSNNETTKYTDNHITYVKFNDKKTDGYILYLMERNGDFRIGISPLWSKNKLHSLTQRAKHESCDKFWVLKYYEDKKSAYFDEQYYSTKYGIPQMIFKFRSQKGKIKQSDIENFYSRFDKKIQYENTIKLLEHHNKKYEYPFWVKGSKNYFSKTHLFEIRACNIFEKIMMVKHFNEKNVTIRTHGKNNREEKHLKGEFHVIDEINYTDYNGYVYSLEVEKDHNYVADNILTHNCIYSFAGADAESYDKLCQIDNTEQLPLSYTYRCGKNIVNYVKKYNEDIIAFENNPEGEILETFSFKNLKNGDMVLCRQSFPVVSLCVKLISMKRNAHVIGIDTGNFIIKTITDAKRDNVEYTMPNVIAQLNHNLTKIIEKVMTTHMVEKSEAMNEPIVFMLDETIKIIETLTKENDTPEMVIDRVKKIFKETKSEGICLSTIHKSKGLEAERVFILHPELMPSKRAITKTEIEQENNLIYVAYTRAIKTLGFIYDYDAFKTYVSLNDENIVVNDSKHVGSVGDKKSLTLEIRKIKEFDGKFGKTKVYEMIDNQGNKFSKFGEISREYLIEGNHVEVGAKIYVYGTIKGHTEFNGEKITQIGRIS